VRLFALDALTRLGPEAKRAAPAVAALLKDPDLAVGTRAAVALLAMREEPKAAVAVLFEALADQKKPEQRLAVEGLARLGDWAAPAAPFLVAQLEKPTVRGWAVAALAALGKGAVAEVSAALGQSTDDSLAVALLEVLARIGPTAREALPVVEKRAASGHAAVVQAAKKAMEQIRKSD
jgi:HEAT repeat protein